MSRPFEPRLGETQASPELEIEVQLDEQLRSLEHALDSDPGSAGMRRAVELAREQRDWVHSLLLQARRYEESGRFPEALERWETLGEVHPNHDDIAAQVRRLRNAVEAAEDVEIEPDGDPVPHAGPASQPEAPSSVARKLKDSGVILAAQLKTAVPKAKGALDDLWAHIPGRIKGQIAALSGESAPPPADPPLPETADDDEEPSAFKPMIFLGGGVAVALLIALFAGAGKDETPGPAPGVQQVDIQAAPAQSEIFIDGELCGRGSCSAELENGMHQISARLLGFAPVRQTVAVQAGRPPQSIRLALEPLAPELSLTTDLDSGVVLIDGEEAGNVEEGELHLESLPFGEHEIVFRSSGLSMKLSYRAEPGEPLVIDGPVEANEVKAAVAAGLSDQILLHAAAEGVEVAVDGAEPRPAPPAGFAPLGLALGRHEAVFSDGSSVEFEVGLRPILVASLTSDRNVGALQVVAGVDDAVVSINGKPYRRKTSRGRLLVYLRPGSYKIGVSKTGFLSSGEKSVEVHKGRRTTIELPLEAEPQNATLIVRGALPGTTVWLDGASAGKVNPSGDLRIGGVEPGDHEIELRLEGYETKTVRRDFPKRSEVAVDGRLKSLAGTLRLRIQPSGVEPALTLQLEGEQPKPVEGRTFRLPPGLYTVRAEASGYKAFSATVLVQTDADKTANLTLEELPKAPVEPRDLIPALERLGWSRQGDLLVRAGAGFTVLPAGPGPGIYGFSLLRQRGRVYWAANYRDEDNHVLYQVKKNELVRTVVANGEKSEETVRQTRFDLDQLLAFRVEVRADAIITSFHDGAQWVEIDRYQGSNLAGRFALYTGRSRYLGRADQLGVRTLTYRPTE